MTKASKRSVPAAVAAGRSRANAWMASARVSGVTVLIVSLSILAVLVLAPTLKIVVEQRQQVADLQAKLSEKKAALDAMNKEKARWDDPAYIRAQARERLYYVMPGEINFLVVNDAPVVESTTDAPTTELQTTDTNWINGALGSVLVAGLTDKPAGASN